MRRKSLSLFVLLIVPLFQALAQGRPFVNEIYRTTEPLYHGDLDLADYDGDGDLDLVTTGRNGDFVFSRVYCHSVRVYTWLIGENDSAYDTVSTYMDIGADVVHLWLSSSKWGDFDADGDQDLLISGLNGTGTGPEIEPVTRLYRYSDGLFRLESGTDLVNVYSGENAWGDMDGDGDLDLIITGATRRMPPYEPTTALYRNVRGVLFRLPTNLPDVAFSAVAWSDVDGDGDLDLALQGDRGLGDFVADVFRNDGGGTFEPMGIGLPQTAFGSFDWGDIDRDGDEDLLMTGAVFDPRIARGITSVYANNGGNLEEVESGLEGVFVGEARFTDFNGDGLADVALAGLPSYESASRFTMYQNLGGGAFTPMLSPAGRFHASVAVGDYNADGDSDVMVAGRLGTGQNDLTVYNNTRFPSQTIGYYQENPDNLPGLALVPDVTGTRYGCFQE